MKRALENYQERMKNYYVDKEREAKHKFDKSKRWLKEQAEKKQELERRKEYESQLIVREIFDDYIQYISKPTDDGLIRDIYEKKIEEEDLKKTKCEICFPLYSELGRYISKKHSDYKEVTIEAKDVISYIESRRNTLVNDLNKEIKENCSHVENITLVNYDVMMDGSNFGDSVYTLKQIDLCVNINLDYRVTLTSSIPNKFGMHNN